MQLHNESGLSVAELCSILIGSVGEIAKRKKSLKAFTEDKGDFGASMASLMPRERIDSDWADDGVFSGFTQPEGQLFTSSPWGRQKNKLRVRVQIYTHSLWVWTPCRTSSCFEPSQTVCAKHTNNTGPTIFAYTYTKVQRCYHVFGTLIICFSEIESWYTL